MTPYEQGFLTKLAYEGFNEYSIWKLAEAVSLNIEGDQVQGVGLRKKLHGLIEEHGADGLAVNNPVDKTVEAILDAEPEVREVIEQELAKQIEAETGSPVSITESDELAEMKDIKLTPEELKDLSAHLFLRFLQSTKAEGKDEWSHSPDITLQKAEEDMMPRYRLTKDEDGNYVGKVPELARKQLMKEEAPYHYMLDDALVASQLEGLAKMHPTDREHFFKQSQAYDDRLDTNKHKLKNLEADQKVYNHNEQLPKKGWLDNAKAYMRKMRLSPIEQEPGTSDGGISSYLDAATQVPAAIYNNTIVRTVNDITNNLGRDESNVGHDTRPMLNSVHDIPKVYREDNWKENANNVIAKGKSNGNATVHAGEAYQDKSRSFA